MAVSTTALVVPVALLGATLVASSSDDGAEAAAPVGQGFTVTPSDIAFILTQIKIAEHHAVSATPADPCAGLVGPGPDQIASPLLSLGLRTVDGSCNHLDAGREFFGASDQVFPRLTEPNFRDAEPAPPGFPPQASSSYTQKKGFVYDSQPRIISNLIVDQTSTNPAAIAAAGFPVRTQGNEGVVPCTVDPTPADPNGTPDGCVPGGETLFIPNVTTDVGLSPPFNSLFTIFGQFFDHGVDQTVKSGGTVFVPLQADDPLVLGPDGAPGGGDDLPPQLRFMVLTRGQNQPGPDGVLGDDPSTPAVDESADDIQNADNTDTPFVDQSQTYTSHSSHQVFLRQYVLNNVGRPVNTGKLVSSPDGGQASWAQVKAQAATLLGLRLEDKDVLNVPMLAVDPYGNFIPGPARGLPQYVTETGLVEGDTAGGGVPVPANVLYFDTPFLGDIAHSAVPDLCDTNNDQIPDTQKTPDANTSAGLQLDPVAACEYDNELLDQHFIAGDGRVNENIALTAVHQVFHSEHDRLVDYIKNVLLTDTSGVTHLTDWQKADGAPDANGVWNGERLFQAARFITEMEYQHLVFEEFARKVQPAINPFQPFAFTATDLNPAVTAEFAHAVYRFGHSMLTETIPRLNEDGSTNDILLLDGFLNPAAYHDGGPAGTLTSDEAMTSIIMGLSDQTGNEIDEFVTDTLRNNLLGLPLDLPTINMTRARSEGIPPLNEVRAQIYAATNDGQLAPYQSWADFGLALKHPESLVNFVAAYGTHPSILSESTIAGKREAARLIVAPDEFGGDVPPADAGDFLYGIQSWDGVETGLNSIDLWVGGLAENTNLFGGLLGSTFNYVFEDQLTRLQNGDRLYYLARTPGMNLRTQLEGNSFAELVMRNSNAHTLKADAFATADCKFEVGLLSSPAPAGSFITGTGSVAEVPSTECSENRLLTRLGDGTYRYRSINSVDPPGINGQSVYNGTAGVDRIFGGNDNDTFWGNLGNDIIDGGGGDDVILGGDGNDLIKDFGGFDFLKGGPGNDAIDGGINDDIILGGDGKDFTNGGANVNETFSGPGDDFAIAGQGEDAVFGDGGDDWMEGGNDPDLLIGDSSSLLFDDHNFPGDDVMIGQSGDDDYDYEGGDDVGVNGQGIEKIAGAAGFDWEINVGNPEAMDADLALPLLGLPLGNNVVRDRYNEVEALSGWNGNDFLRGDDVVPTDVNDGGFIGCDALDQDGLDRIAGLDALVPPLTVDPAPIIAAAATLYCPLVGPVWGAGNILLGGNGTDVIEGRGADDIIDGDRYLNVRLSVHSPGTATEIGSTDLMTHAALSGNFGPGTTATTTLQQAVFAGLIDAGDIYIVREVLTPTTPTGTDTAVFSGPVANYTVTFGAGFVTVTDNVGDDGVDTLFNMERVQFTDGIVNLNRPVASTSVPSLTFPTRSIGTPTTAAQPVVLTNTGVTNLNISGIGFVTGNTASFSQTNNCVSPLTPGQSCTINVTMLTTGPAATKSSNLRILSNAQNSPTLVPVTGVIVTNSVPTGVPTISDPRPTESSPLIADASAIADADGTTTSTFNFQWQQSAAGGAAPFTNIAGETSPAFTPTQAQVNTRLRVVVTFVDDHGRTETRTSAQSAAVVGDLFPSAAEDNTVANVVTFTAGDDDVDGGLGNDNLNTAAGNDLLTGGAGNDTLNGGGGNDLLRYAVAAFGADIVNGFDADPTGGQDLIDITAYGLTPATFGGTVTFTPGATFTIVNIAGGGTIRINGVLAANLDVTDFKLV